VLTSSPVATENQSDTSSTWPSDPLAYQVRQSLARLLFVQGKLDEAPKLQRGKRWNCSQPPRAAIGGRYLWRSSVAMAHFARGDRPAADAALAELIDKDRNVMAYQVAKVYAWRGETDNAFEWLQISVDNHDTGLLSLLIDPLAHSLRQDIRYNALLAKVGLPR
jgi:hypothetical protein